MILNSFKLLSRSRLSCCGDWRKLSYHNISHPQDSPTLGAEDLKLESLASLLCFALISCQFVVKSFYSSSLSLPFLIWGYIFILQLFFFLNISRYFYGENNDLTCCSPQSKTSSVVYYFSPLKSLFSVVVPNGEKRLKELPRELRGPQRSEAVGWFWFVYLLIYVYTYV